MTITDTLAGWTRLWNGETDLAHDLVTDDFTIHFGGLGIAAAADDVRGPKQFAALVGDFLAARPPIVYSHALTFEADGHAVSIWNADSGERHVGGIDAFELASDGRIERAWSVTGERPMGQTQEP